MSSPQDTFSESKFDAMVIADALHHDAENFSGSALVLCGRRWHCSVDDSVLPSICKAFLHFPIFCVILIIYSVRFSGNEYHGCQQDENLHVFVILEIVLYFVICAIDIMSILISFSMLMHQKNQIAIGMLVSNYLLVLVHLAVTVYGTIYAFADSCSLSDNIKTISQFLVIFNWIMIGFSLCWLCLVWNSDGLDEDVFLDRHEVAVQNLTCSWLWSCTSEGLKEDPQIFRVIARILRGAFYDFRNFVFSDLIMGLALVKSVQQRRKESGKQYFIAEEGSNKNQSVETPSDCALKGIQPDLLPEDWHRITRARYYANFAIGSYGWPLYVFTQPCSFCDLCTSCCLPFVDGIEGDNCFHCSIKAFMIRTNLPAVNAILQANLDTDIGRVIYFVAADHDKKSLVIAIRGSMSLQDGVTDMHSVPKWMNDLNSPNNYSHAGWINAAVRLKNDLETKGTLSSFFAEHPDYHLVVCGHSLGAAAASLLSTFLVKIYPSLHCYAYGCPLIFDAEMAAASRSYITNIAYNEDMICRWSHASVLRLKAQMRWAFANSRLSKWKYLLTSTEGMPKSDMSSPLAGDSSNPFSHIPAEIIISVGDASLRSAVFSERNEEVKSESIAVEIKAPPFTLENPQSWPEFHPPGILYQIIPFWGADHTLCSGNRNRLLDATPNQCIVFRASPSAYQELIIVPNMLLDHLPYHYTESLNNLHIPLD